MNNVSTHAKVEIKYSVKRTTTYVLEDLVLLAFEALAVATESIRSPLNSCLYASCAEAEAKAATKSRATDLIMVAVTDDN
jgi:hypothetical protein